MNCVIVPNPSKTEAVVSALAALIGYKSQMPVQSSSACSGLASPFGSEPDPSVKRLHLDNVIQCLAKVPSMFARGLTNALQAYHRKQELFFMVDARLVTPAAR